MSASILDGRAVCDDILTGVTSQVGELNGSGWPLQGLEATVIGHSEIVGKPIAGLV